MHSSKVLISIGLAASFLLGCALGTTAGNHDGLQGRKNSNPIDLTCKLDPSLPNNGLTPNASDKGVLFGLDCKPLTRFGVLALNRSDTTKTIQFDGTLTEGTRVVPLKPGEDSFYAVFDRKGLVSITVTFEVFEGDLSSQCVPESKN